MLDLTKPIPVGTFSNVREQVMFTEFMGELVSWKRQVPRGYAMLAIFEGGATYLIFEAMHLTSLETDLKKVAVSLKLIEPREFQKLLPQA